MTSLPDVGLTGLSPDAGWAKFCSIVFILGSRLKGQEQPGQALMMMHKRARPSNMSTFQASAYGMSANTPLVKKSHMTKSQHQRAGKYP